MQRWGLILPVCLLASCSTTSPPRIDERQITSRVGIARSPVLSRDGTAIAFAAVADGYTNPQIWVGRADGSAPPRPLTNDASQNYDPEFSPDGRSIYFTSTREPQGIYRVPSSGGAPELVIPNACCVENLARRQHDSLRKRGQAPSARSCRRRRDTGAPRHRQFLCAALVPRWHAHPGHDVNG